VSRLYESPTLSLLHDALKLLQIPRARPPAEDFKGGSNDVYRIPQSHDDYHDIAGRIEHEARALGISQSMIQRAYPATSMQHAMLLQAGSHSGLYVT
jgi:hypothetical protein